MTALTEARVRVIAQEKGFYRITDGTEIKTAVVSGKFRFEAARASDFPTVGDYVLVRQSENDGNAVIESLFPRKSIFVRRAAGKGSGEQAVAANIDTVFICMSLNENYNLRRLERYLSVAYDSGAEPVIILTKADLCNDTESAVREARRIAPGVDVIAISSLDGAYREIKRFISPGKTAAFLGSSGVGKSTLINKLAGAELIVTRETGNGGKGRHTTTHRELITLPDGAFVIDTPGMRELGMWDSGEGIETAFSDIEELTKKCRFSNCTHTSEPGCAVTAALKLGTLDTDRWKSFLMLKSENDFSDDRIGCLDAKREKFKKIAKINKMRGKMN